ncbi:MAG: cytochrome c biogenesis protein ResB [Bacteroidales bacterium]|nr:cytochrome c biogenesis protein ResB [Bacteroidales bacterium]
MWTKPWKMTEGFLIGGGLLLAGVLLRKVAGPIDWSVFAWPVNLIVLILLVAGIGVMYVLRRRVYAFEWMMHSSAAVPCLLYAAVLTIVMGLLPQVRAGGIPWLSQMLTFWPFVLIWAWMMVISALAALNHLLRWKVREIPFILNHLGVVVAIVAATLGNADTRSLQMTVFSGSPEWRAVDDEGMVQEPGLAIELHKFTMEEYPDHSPKRFASDISVYTEDGQSVQGVVEVNKPLKVNGWKIYQYGYDSSRGAESEYSVFQLVHDPWIFWVYLGIFMMIAGAVCLMLFMAPKPVRQ